METIRSASVYGLGLIGGSIAKALKYKAGISEIYACSRTYKDVEKAFNENVIAKPFKEPSNEFFDVDMIFICTPVGDTIQFMEKYQRELRKIKIVTDAGSTKSDINSHAKKLDLINYIGGHPMAGSEKTGYINSYAHLFENAFYILTVSANTDRELLREYVSIVSAIGAVPIILDPEEHDHITAVISHLPHVVATALVNLANDENQKDNSIERLAAGGFKDITRIASSSPVMWESIIRHNKENVEKTISKLIDELKRFVQIVKTDDKRNLLGYFEAAKDFRDSLKDKSRGAYIESFEITVDIEDKPGSIAKVAKILADCDINVKNINIPANREFEDGCLILSFEDEKARIHALSVLNKNDIKAYKR